MSKTETEQFPDKSCREDDDCPTDGAVLKREWRELRADLERERIRLAACGVVAMANTPESAEKARMMHEDYRSGSCDNVARAVDSEMALRAALRTVMNYPDVRVYLVGPAKRPRPAQTLALRGECQ